jgi:hypothetical protein
MKDVALKDYKVSEQAVLSFYKAICKAEYLVNSRKPNLLVGPLRGAEPIIESLKIIAGLEGHEFPPVLYVETGSIDKVLEEGKILSPKPLRDEQKVQLVGQRLEPHVQDYGKLLNLCLIDEVESGGSIVKNYDYINGALRIFYPSTDYNLEAIAICGPKDKCGRFKQLWEMGRITPLFVDDLFTVDRTGYLSPLVRTGDNVQQKGAYPKDLKSGLYNEVIKLHRAV